MAAPPQVRLDGFLDKYLPEIAAQARECLEILRARLPGAVQMIYDNYQWLVIGFGPTEKPSEAVFSLVVAPDHLTLCFLQGIRVPDPLKLLQGTGSLVRNLRLAGPADLDKPEVRELMDAAMEGAKVPFDPAAPGKLIIRAIAAKQRPRRPATKA